MAFQDWSSKSWTVASHSGSPAFFEAGRVLRFRDQGGDKTVESVKEPLAAETKICLFSEEKDEMIVEFSAPAQTCVVSRFVRSEKPLREVLVCRVVNTGGGIGEAGSWTALDGSGDEEDCSG